MCLPFAVCADFPVYMLDNDHHSQWDVELQSILYYKDDDDDNDDSQLSLEGDNCHGKDISSLQNRRIKKKMEKLKRKRKKPYYTPRSGRFFRLFQYFVDASFRAFF